MIRYVNGTGQVVQTTVLDLCDELRKNAIDMGDGKLYYNVHRLSIVFEIPSYFFERLIQQGLLRGVRIGKTYIVSATDVGEFIMSGEFEKKRKFSASLMNGDDSNFTKYDNASRGHLRKAAEQNNVDSPEVQLIRKL